MLLYILIKSCPNNTFRFFFPNLLYFIYFNIEIKNFSFASSFPFTLTGQLPGGGSVDLAGKAGPIDPDNAALTPLETKIKVRQLSLTEAVFLDPASGISGIADYDASGGGNKTVQVALA